MAKKSKRNGEKKNENDKMDKSSACCWHSWWGEEKGNLVPGSRHKIRGRLRSALPGKLFPLIFRTSGECEKCWDVLKSQGNRGGRSTQEKFFSNKQEL